MISGLPCYSPLPFLIRSTGMAALPDFQAAGPDFLSYSLFTPCYGPSRSNFVACGAFYEITMGSGSRLYRLDSHGLVQRRARK